jgi:thiamine biosynthesis protein ThiI
MDVVSGLPGVANVSLAEKVPRDLAALTEACVNYMGRLLAARDDAAGRPPTFAVAVERKDKRYPLRSYEVAALLGQAIRDRFPHLTVNLTRPDLRVQVEILEHGALLFDEKRPGPGGLAVGSSGTAVCLMSGGIDSPVAAYQMMTRGVTVVHLNFHSYPFIGEQSREKVREIVRFLARYQPRSRLYIAPFADIQTAIRDRCPEPLRTILYRRMMNRVANVVAEREGALALVTGESVGQVASQTLENLRAIHATAALPVLQPLIGLAKPEIIDRARRVGTYAISIQPFPDCCTLFQPRHPETKADLKGVERAEALLPVDALVQASVAGLEITDYGPEYYPAGWQS